MGIKNLFTSFFVFKNPLGSRVRNLNVEDVASALENLLFIIIELGRRTYKINNNTHTDWLLPGYQTLYQAASVYHATAPSQL